MTSAAGPLLQVRGLEKRFPVRAGRFGSRKASIRALDGVGFDVARGETLALVGESGCGKSTAGLAIMQLEPADAGSVVFDGQDLAKLTQSELRKARRRFQMVFQDPVSSFNPRMTIGAAIAEAVAEHHPGLSATEVDRRVSALLADVGLSGEFKDRYPHTVSGGQCQRAAIARALASDPDLLVCDEVVSALDVSVQAQIINLLQEIQERRGISCIFISHDLAVVRHLSARVAVMYLGQVVELSPTAEIFDEPLHPYTRALIASEPGFEAIDTDSSGEPALLGEVPSPLNPPAGCRFHPRCPVAVERCAGETPALRAAGHARSVACHLVDANSSMHELAANPSTLGRARSLL